MRERPFVAGWSVFYPTTPSADGSEPEVKADEIWRMLQSMLLVNWHWDLFIWDLRRLLHLLTTAPAEFDYLFVTDYLRARAAYLLNWLGSAFSSSGRQRGRITPASG